MSHADIGLARVEASFSLLEDVNLKADRKRGVGFLPGGSFVFPFIGLRKVSLNMDFSTKKG